MGVLLEVMQSNDIESTLSAAEFVLPPLSEEIVFLGQNCPFRAKWQWKFVFLIHLETYLHRILFN